MMATRAPACGGFTFFGLLFAIMLIGLALAGASAVWQVQQQRHKEQQLLYIGKQYSDAIASYYKAAPGGAKQYPRKLTELLRDPRYPTVKRHIRKLWPDPLTNSGDWALVTDSQGGIAGIYSRARGKPLMQPDFGDDEFDGAPKQKQSYAQWKFIYTEGMSVDELVEVYRDDSGKKDRR